MKWVSSPPRCRLYRRSMKGVNIDFTEQGKFFLGKKKEGNKHEYANYSCAAKITASVASLNCVGFNSLTFIFFIFYNVFHVKQPLCLLKTG